MDRERLKSITLIVLLCVNLCFLLLLFVGKREDRQVRDAARAALVEIFKKSGVELSPSLELDETEPRSYTLLRSAEAEQVYADRLLKNVEIADQGGNIYVYSGKLGQAIFRGTGEFEMLMESDAFEGNERRIVSTVLKRLGISAGEPTDPSAGEYTELTCTCLFDGSEIFNCRVTLRFRDGSLQLVTGIRPFDRFSENAQTGAMDATTALIRFLQISTDAGYVYSGVEDIQLGYVMKPGVSGECGLEPVWKIVTDAGEYYINALNGETERLAE